MLKTHLKGFHFKNDEVIGKVSTLFRKRHGQFFMDVFKKHVLCWRNCVETNENYLGK